MYRVFSNETTRLAYTGTPEAPNADVAADQRDRVGFVHPSIPGQGLPDGHPVGVNCVLSPGMNSLTSNECAFLLQDVNFLGHLKAGYVVFMDDEGRAIDPPEAPEYVPEPAAAGPALPVVNAGAETLPDERTDAAAADGKVKTGPANPPPSATTKEVEDFFSLNAEEQAAMRPALTAEAAALVEADPRSKPAGGK